MYKKSPLAAFILTLLLTGCAGSPAHISTLNTEELKEVNTLALCNAYHFSPSDAVRQEIESRGVITDYEWSLVAEKKIRVGMSEEALVCAWGGPKIYGTINKMTTQYGTRKQYVYRGCTYCRANYVYVEGGKVTGFQN